ncbi:hypothetical protein ACFO1B_00315 [Dactylosporangium siamense]|uniref:Uncharacterized protein n=1 Tax=Dactylosporangium siamense TaxID=685454 RepID=A0A919PE16_9ACTN|nr:hypothetical protein [Dactylosporangium siamense]GIG42209.1 hypothetical protein Dsi01nite_002500 [Dactylosporangium siamense]
MAAWWAAAAVLVAAFVVLVLVRRRRRPRTRAETLRAARGAMKGLRAADGRARRRPYLGRSETASSRDRCSAGLAENATYSDAADYSSGGDGGGGSD